MHIRVPLPRFSSLFVVNMQRRHSATWLGDWTLIRGQQFGLNVKTCWAHLVLFPLLL